MEIVFNAISYVTRIRPTNIVNEPVNEPVNELVNELVNDQVNALTSNIIPA